MRLWSLHPRYMDCRGLVALWRESLLARKVLEGKTRGYRNHPQLERFRSHPYPVAAMNTYLLHIWEEGNRRGYRFDRRKIGNRLTKMKIEVPESLMESEFRHLKGKLRYRDPAIYRELSGVGRPEPHPVFLVAKGFNNLKKQAKLRIVIPWRSDSTTP